MKIQKIFTISLLTEKNKGDKDKISHHVFWHWNQ